MQASPSRIWSRCRHAQMNGLTVFWLGMAAYLTLTAATLLGLAAVMTPDQDGLGFLFHGRIAARLGLLGLLAAWAALVWRCSIGQPRWMRWTVRSGALAFLAEEAWFLARLLTT